MSAGIAAFNALSKTEAEDVLLRACGAKSWARAVAARRPFTDVDNLVDAAHEVWSNANRADILEAFEHHPRIGADVEKLREKFAATATLSEGEQSGVAGASEATLEALRDGNLRYEARYGHIFIVCATDKSAEQMLALLEARMRHSGEQELQIAAAEQAKITEIRLRGMFVDPN